jgi:Zn-dependent oligopeptidase
VHFQANNCSSCAKDITEEILANIDMQLSSGTVKKLIDIGPRLSEVWPIPQPLKENQNSDFNVNLSLSITKDFVQIMSDLYHQDHAWDEMWQMAQERYSTKLISANEMVAFR